MWKFIKKSSPLEKVRSYWNTFLEFHTHICENDRDDLQKPASAYPEIGGLHKLLDILLEEDNSPSPTRSMRLCMEYVVTSKVFEILTAAGQIDMPGGLLEIVINFFTFVLREIKNQDFIPQMSFHTSLSSLLHILNSLIPTLTGEMKKSVLKLIYELLNKIHKNTALIELFIYNDGKKSELLPVSLLLFYFNEHDFIEYEKNAFFVIPKIRDAEIVSIIIRSHEFALNLVTKLAVYFQRKDVYCIQKMSEFFHEFYCQCVNRELQDEILDIFYENFCVQILTPRLQSSEFNTRLNASILLTIIVQEFTSQALLITIVYFLQGKERNGNKRLKPLVSTPTSSQGKKFDFTIDLNRGCKPLSDVSKMWETLLENLNSSHEQLSIYTLKIIYFLLAHGGKKVAMFLITDYFSGTPPTGNVTMTAEIFLSLIPQKILPKLTASWYSDYLSSGSFKCSSALSSSTIHLHEYSEHTGAQSFKAKAGETGGTQPRLNNLLDLEANLKFFEGDILHIIMQKFKNFLCNSVDENIFITGIISTLSAFPKEIGSFSALHNFLLEPQTSTDDNFLTFFKLLALEINHIADSDECLEEKLEISRYDLGLPSNTFTADSFYNSLISSAIRSKKLKCLEVENKLHIEAILIFQEFVKEVASILLFKEILDDMSMRARIDDEDLSN